MDGGPARVLTASLDRNILSPVFSRDGASVLFLLEDERVTHLARVPTAGGSVERVVEGRRTLEDLSLGRDGRIAVTSSTPDRPTEVFAVEGRELRKVSAQNDAWLAQVRLAPLEEITFKSRDGTSINGFVLKPLGYRAGTRYPTLLRIHGGPVWQFFNDFANLDWQVFAAQGYVVVGVNPRGSSGRGEKFSTAIFADWGEKDGDDVLAAVDHLVAAGIADPERLGVGGWSYGGILTNQVIARDRRFKAATSGAGQGNALLGYGTDMYTLEYELELGKPWASPDTWRRVSQPFLRADRIVTPTLFLCGQEDWNVPLINSEQMYQALKSLGRETELIIYPGRVPWDRATLVRAGPDGAVSCVVPKVSRRLPLGGERREPLGRTAHEEQECRGGADTGAGRPPGGLRVPLQGDPTPSLSRRSITRSWRSKSRITAGATS